MSNVRGKQYETKNENDLTIPDLDMQQTRRHSIFRMLSLDGAFQFRKECGLDMEIADNLVIQSAAKKAHSDLMGEADAFYMIDYSPENISRVVNAFLERLIEKLEPEHVDRFVDWAFKVYCDETEDGLVE